MLKRHLYPGCCQNHLSTLRETSPKTLKRRAKKRIPEKLNQTPHLKVPWTFQFLGSINPLCYLNPQSRFSISYRESFPSNVEASQLLTRSPKPSRVSPPPSFHVTLLCPLLSRQPGLLFTEPTSLFLLWCCQLVFSPSVCCCPSSLTLVSPQHSTLTLTCRTSWPSPLSIPALTCLRPVRFQQPHKRSRGGQSRCELEIVLGATGKYCI